MDKKTDFQRTWWTWHAIYDWRQHHKPSRWNRIKYDWANQMYRTMLNNFWIPEEISLNEDVKQFPYLTDYERRAFW